MAQQKVDQTAPDGALLAGSLLDLIRFAGGAATDIDTEPAKRFWLPAA